MLEELFEKYIYNNNYDNDNNNKNNNKEFKNIVKYDGVINKNIGDSTINNIIPKRITKFTVSFDILSKIAIPDTVEKLTIIFSNEYQKLDSISIPSSVIYLKLKNYEALLDRDSIPKHIKYLNLSDYGLVINKDCIPYSTKVLILNMYFPHLLHRDDVPFLEYILVREKRADKQNTYIMNDLKRYRSHSSLVFVGPQAIPTNILLEKKIDYKKYLDFNKKEREYIKKNYYKSSYISFEDIKNNLNKKYNNKMMRLDSIIVIFFVVFFIFTAIFLIKDK